MQLELPPQLWWTRVAVSGGYGYLFADNADLADWPSWMRSVAGDDLAEYRDFGGGVYRAACVAGDRIETCLFVGPAQDAGDWEVVKSLFAADALSGSAPDVAVGQIDRRVGQRRADRLCLFRRRPQHDLRRHRRRRNSAAAIGARLKAGTNCGSCIPELKRLIAQASTSPSQKSIGSARSILIVRRRLCAVSNPAMPIPRDGRNINARASG